MGVRFIAINDGVDSLVEGSNDFSPIRNWANELHAKDSSKKVRAVKKLQAERGERLGGRPPYGYKKVDEDSKEILPDDEAAAVVQRIFSLCASGKGPNQIARILREDKVLTPSNYYFQKPCSVLYNTVESDTILALSETDVSELADDGRTRLVAVGTLKASKGYDRMLRIIRRLNEENYPVHLYILGIGPEQQALKKYVLENSLGDCVTFLGYRTNPYKYVSKCDLFICASHAEGFSTAATEALIAGTPVCTVEVSGMREMLGEHDEYGIVTENSEEALYQGIKRLLDDPALLARYRQAAAVRGNMFSTEHTVHAVEEMLLCL